MVARLIHRYATKDNIFYGAHESKSSIVHKNSIIIFGAEEEAARAIRDASAFGNDKEHQYDNLVDLGNLQYPQNQIKDLLNIIHANSCIPVMLGGNDELAGLFLDGVIRCAKKNDTGVVLISPNLQVSFNDYESVKALAVGIKRFIAKDSYQKWQGANRTLISLENLTNNSIETALVNASQTINRVWLIVDLSVLDIGYASGSAAPVTGGLSPTLLISIVNQIISNFDIEALGLINLKPERDFRGHSERVAAIVCSQILSKVARRTA